MVAIISETSRVYRNEAGDFNSIEVFFDLPACLVRECTATANSLLFSISLSPILNHWWLSIMVMGRHTNLQLSQENLVPRLRRLMFKEKYFSCNITSKHKPTTAFGISTGRNNTLFQFWGKLTIFVLLCGTCLSDFQVSVSIYDFCLKFLLFKVLFYYISVLISFATVTSYNKSGLKQQKFILHTLLEAIASPKLNTSLTKIGLHFLEGFKESNARFFPGSVVASIPWL